MNLLDTRLVFRPFQYEKAHEYWLKQSQAHWLHTEISMESDINDWKTKLNEHEKNVIAAVLKIFAQTEVVIEDYWASKVARWFKIPEIQAMCHTFASFESIHSIAYAYLNDSLGLDNFSEFLKEIPAKAKIDRLLNVKGKTKEEIVKSLAIFSAFTEGMQLFSSFAILAHFSTKNLLKGVGQIIEYSIRDESLHSEAGCWLFKTFIEEYPEVMTKELKEEIYEAARLSVELEDNFIDLAFKDGKIKGLDPSDLKVFIRARTNTKLGDLGFASNWKNLDKEALSRMEWFNSFSTGLIHSDFFASRVTSYSKGTQNWDSMYD